MSHPWMGGAISPERLRPPRTITQLCGAERLFALCSDGTVWELLGGVWLPTPGIPQRQVGGGE